MKNKEDGRKKGERKKQEKNKNKERGWFYPYLACESSPSTHNLNATGSSLEDWKLRLRTSECRGMYSWLRVGRDRAMAYWSSSPETKEWLIYQSLQKLLMCCAPTSVFIKICVGFCIGSPFNTITMKRAGKRPRANSLTVVTRVLCCRNRLCRNDRALSVTVK